MQWDNRAQNGNNCSDFKHASTGERLSSYCPKSLQPFTCLEDTSPVHGRDISAQYKEVGVPRFHSGRIETKLTEKDGRGTLLNCNEQKLKTNISTLLAALKASGSSRDLERGKKIHADAIESGDDSNIYVASTLVDMYAKCRSIEDARGVFDSMRHHDVVSWTALMLGYAENGEGEVALKLFACMRREGFAPDARTFVAALKACTSLAAKEEGKHVDGKLVKMGSLEKGMAIHSQAAKSGCDSNLFVASTLVDMYAKCGSMVDACGVFDWMPRQNVVAWNALMLGYAENREGELALQFLEHMRPEGCAPDARTFVAALKACTSLAAKEEGKQVDGKLVKMGSLEKGMAIHSQAAKSGCEADRFVTSTLVNMYAKCGSMVDARGVFDRMLGHDVVSWNAIILGYAENGESEVALQLFACMRPEGCAPDALTFVAALKASCSNRDLETGRKIHADALESGDDSNIYVANTLVDMYAKCGSMGDAREVFDKMPCHNVVSRTALMVGYVENGEGELALQLFAHMQFEGCAPDARTFVAALKACTSLAAKEDGKQVDGKLVKMGSLEKGMTIHSQAAKSGCDSDIFVASSLVEMYAKCGNMVAARGVFDRMPRHDVVSWNTLMVGYTENGKDDVALQLVASMQFEGCARDARTFVVALKACTSLAAKEEGKQVDGKLVKKRSLEKGMAIHSQAAKSGCDLDIFVASTLVDMYAKCGSMVDARGVFDRMPSHDVVAWSSIILGYAENGEAELALQLLAHMRPQGCEPDTLTSVAALKACGSVAALEFGKTIHADIRRCGLESNAIVANTLVNFYGKCGNMVDAQQVFDSHQTRDLVTWTALMGGYSRQGDTNHVFDLFERMQKERVQADGITFVSILTACSHAGLVDKGKEYFEAMWSKYGITPGIEHFHCMIDLLGRANQLDEAVAMVKNMPFEPNVVTWKTVLGACRKWKNVVVGRLAFESVLKLDEKQAAAYLLMANIYGSVGMLEEKSNVQSMRRNVGAWKKPGQSWWTDQAGMVHKFVVGDTSHPQSEDILAKLKHVMVRMKEQVYVDDVDSVLHDISEDEEDALCGHSEKLAIACALINTVPGTTIRIVKNLGVCDDCHKATAIISKMEQRQIICRDASRFHVFKDGRCSCGDSW